MRPLLGLLLVCTLLANPVPGAPLEPVDTAIPAPPPAARIEREIREALPVGISSEIAFSWLEAQGARFHWRASDGREGFWRLTVQPGRRGLAVPYGTVIIEGRDANWQLQCVTASVRE